MVVVKEDRPRGSHERIGGWTVVDIDNMKANNFYSDFQFLYGHFLIQKQRYPDCKAPRMYVIHVHQNENE